MSGKSEKSAVKVMVRVRPFNKRELDLEGKSKEGPTSIVLMHNDDETVQILDKDGCIKDTFDFHRSFWSIPAEQATHCNKQFTDQAAVYEETGKPAVKTALSARHCCIFAYGQTGSGKTYSMLGSDAQPGISPRIVDQTFAELEAMGGKHQGFSFSVEISFMEIYNERVKDLLSEDPAVVSPLGRKKSKKSLKAYDDSTEYKDLKVRNSPTVGVYVEGLTRLGKEQGLKTAEDVKKVMRAGMEHRATAETNMNATSSRSHAIFQLCIRSKNEAKGIQKYANINLVDLAGSERINLSGAEGTRLVEATRINLSLSTLRRVIDILIENSVRKRNDPKLVPPYRDSTLTWILSESLGGNSVTMMLATVSPFEGNREDTVNTLRYAYKAKSIVNNVRVNEEKGQVVVSALQKELVELRKKMKNEEADPTSRANLNSEIQNIENQKRESELATMQQQNAIQQRIEDLERAEAEALAVERELKQLQNEDVEANLEEALEMNKEIEAELERKLEEAKEKERSAEQNQQRLEAEKKTRQELEDAKEAVKKREEAFAHEVKLVKRKQFALAFQKAFTRVGQSSGLQKLEAEVKNINEKVLTSYLDEEKTASSTRSLERTNEHFGFSITRLEGDVTKAELRNRSTQEANQTQLANMTEEKREAEEEAKVYKQRQRHLQSTLCSFRDVSGKKTISSQRQHAQLRARRDVLQDGLDKKKELIKQLKDQRECLNKEITTLREKNAEERGLKVENITKTKELRKQIESEKTLERSHQEEELRLRGETIRNRNDIRMAMERCEDLRDVVSEVTRSHGDLKRFVSFRFFATGGFEGHTGDSKFDEFEVAPFAGDRVWTNDGYAYRRSNSPSSPMRSNSPLSPRRASPSPLTPRRHASGSPQRASSRSPSFLRRKVASSTPREVVRRSMSPFFKKRELPS
eukprot:TRINITY_DN12859_c3_g1_i1.p1 TRINITY_DN12859_c3_g1~~TRINITY_DN12859_c3_g1_i1.p1  ORF type:complete len:923 (+),score=220.97 TRINITY_DN12859_c3_g1_i1:77-2845(+)